MNTFSKTENVIIDFIIRFCDFFKDNNVLVTFLLSLVDGIYKVDIYWFIIIDEMLLSMFNNTVWTKWHKTIHIATEISQKF